MNFNYNSNFNDPMYAKQMHIHPQPNYNVCPKCAGAEKYFENGIQYPCLHENTAYTTTTNFNTPPEIISAAHIHTGHYKRPNIFNRGWHALKDSFRCGSHKFRESYTKSGRPKYCYECIRVNGYCPICENTGYKKHNGKRCKCGLI